MFSLTAYLQAPLSTIPRVEKMENSYSFQVVCSSPIPFNEESLFWILEDLGIESMWSQHLLGNEVETYGLLMADPGNAWVDALTMRLNDLGGGEKVWKVSVRPYQSSNWLKEWKKFYKPEKVGCFWILPKWESPENYRGIPVRIDPGMAFGTGGHPTTRMPLLFIEEILKGEEPGYSLLDMGTGSGILAIAASRLLDGAVVGVDNDITALENAEKNVVLNGVQVQLGTSIPENTTYDFIVSNILAEIHVELSGQYRSSLKPEGKIVLSGILDTKKEMVLKAMSELGFQLEDELFEGEWVCLLLNLNV